MIIKLYLSIGEKIKVRDFGFCRLFWETRRR